LAAEGRIYGTLGPGLSGVAIVLALTCGFLNTGLPAHHRLLDLDDRRVADLSAISAEIAADYRARQTLAATLNSRADWRDPQTRAPYEYRRIDANRYELCAGFAAAGHRSFAHKAGRTCFTLTPEFR
jgi:hypothetical protein